jgi:hypothetical protein
MLGKTHFVKYSYKNFTNNYISPKVSLIQRPGDSYRRRVTLIPGEGIGRELVSKNYH